MSSSDKTWGQMSGVGAGRAAKLVALGIATPNALVGMTKEQIETIGVKALPGNITLFLGFCGFCDWTCGGWIGRNLFNLQTAAKEWLDANKPAVTTNDEDDAKDGKEDKKAAGLYNTLLFLCHVMPYLFGVWVGGMVTGKGGAAPKADKKKEDWNLADFQPNLRKRPVKVGHIH
jgi:hypothetical protein